MTHVLKIKMLFFIFILIVINNFLYYLLTQIIFNLFN